MEQAIKDQILKQWEEYDKKDYQEEYKYFNDNYSLDELKRLEVKELAERLFASVNYSNSKGIPRGYFCWSESGRKINGETIKAFGTAKGWSGGQDGPLIDEDGSAHFSEIGAKRSQRTRKTIDDNQLNDFAETTRNALESICDLTRKAALNNVEDYRKLNSQIKACLLDLNENRLYWKSDGEPSGQLMKYLHCTFPDKFFCWYSKGKLQNLLEEIDPSVNRDEDAFILNGLLTIIAKNIGITDLDNFGVMIGRLIKKDRRGAFKKWLSKQTKENGEHYSEDTIKTYTSTMQKGFKKFSPLINDYRTVFHIGDLDTFEKAYKDIVGNPGFEDFTVLAGNGSCQAGLKKYKEFLTGEENEADYEIEDTMSTTNSGTDKLDIKKNTILYGPPGTGKTYSTMQYAVAIIKNRSLSDVKSDDIEDVKAEYKQNTDEGLIEFVTFHQSYGYEDFIEGIKPIVESEEDENDDSDVKYKVVPGVFKAFCEFSDKSKPASGITLSSSGRNDASEKNRVFIIDEINRGNISKIFGELITLIEENKRIGAPEEKYAKLPYSQKSFGVPGNIYILGTMNTADRSIATIDTALRRRFDFVEMLPNAEYLDDIMVGDELNIKDLFVKMNQKITALYDREHAIGQAYFKPLVDEKNNTGKATIYTLGQIFKKSIIPLLQEYFYDDYNKIRLVLGDNKTQNETEQFIKASEKDYSSLFGTNVFESEVVVSYEINEEAFYNIEAYKHI